MDMEDNLTRARHLISSSIMWDNHACMPNDENFLPQIERCRDAGFDVVSLNVGFGTMSLESHLRMLGNVRRWFSARPDKYVLAASVADIDRARAQGKLAIIFDIEGMAPLNEGDHGLIKMFYDLGVRWMLIAYNRNNAAGGGCVDEDTGLTGHGRAILAEMKRVGMVVCCSHTGHKTARHVMEHAENPVIFSHSNASAVHQHYRNIPDDLIKACAATGGVVGVNGIGVFLGKNDDRPETVFRHIDHMVQLVGPEHVGVALDYVFDQEPLLAAIRAMRGTPQAEPLLADEPLKMVAPEALLPIVETMVSHGYSDGAIAGILGANWRRVAAQVWR